MSEGQGEGNSAAVEEGGAGTGTAKGSQQMVMDDHLTRDSFNAAYESVEAAIRNFSKDKLGYEQQIEDLNYQLGQGRESLQKLSAENQDVISENRRLLQLHEESEKSKVALDALISTVEQKQQIIIDAIAGFEQLEVNMCARNDDHEKFIVALKFRQSQLLKWIDSTKEKNDALTATIQKLQESLQSSVKDANEARMIIQKKDKELIDKVARLEKCDADFANMECEYKLCLTDLEAEKGQSEDFKKLCLDLEGRCKSFNEELAELKVVLHTKTADFANEKQTIQNQYTELKKLSLDLEDRCKTSNEELVEVKALLQTTTTNFATEEQILQDQCTELKKLSLDLEGSCKTSNEELAELKAVLQTKTADFATEKQILQDQYTELKKISFDLEGRCKSSNEELDEVKALLQTTTTDFATEKQILQDQYTELRKLSLDLEGSCKTSNEELAELKALLQTTTVDFATEKQILQDQCAELKTLSLDLEGSCKTSNEELAELKAVLHTKTADFATEKQILQDQCTELKTLSLDLEGRCKTSNEELDEVKALLQTTTADLATEKQIVQDQCTELKKLSLDFETEKERLNEEHDQKMQDEKRESDCCKRELKALNKRYHEQKLAISKLVEEVGVRPVLLPPSDPSRARARVTPSQEYQVTAPQRALPSPLPRPSVTGSGLITPTRSVDDKSRRSILKRSKDDSSTDTRSKNVTFGETSIADFLITSESETDSSGDVYIPHGKGATSSKRIKLTGEKTEPYKPPMDPSQRKNDEEGGKQRKYFKNRIAAPNKSPAVAP